jgi:hypothetical protein
LWGTTVEHIMTLNTSEVSPFNTEQAQLLALAGWIGLVHRLSHADGSTGWAVEARKGLASVTAYADTLSRAARMVVGLVMDWERSRMATRDTPHFRLH